MARTSVARRRSAAALDAAQVEAVADAGAALARPSPGNGAPATPAPTELPPTDRLAPAGGCSGCAWELGAPTELVPAPPGRGRAGSWLTRHQGEDGSWSPSSPGDDPCWRRPGHYPGDPRLTLGTTALAVLAFAGSGQTHRFGREKRVLLRALRWLKEQQGADGQLGWGSGPEAGWEHTVATFALCELYAVSRDFSLKPRAEQALAVCLDPLLERVTAGQDPAQGGWLVLALAAARSAKLEVPEQAFTQLREAFPLDGCDDRAVALLVHLLAGGSQSDPRVERVAEALGAEVLRWEPGQVDLQRWYFTTCALFQTGGSPWKAWHERLLKVLYERGRPRVHSAEVWRCGVGEPAESEPEPEPPMDCREGSWDPIGAWGTLHGRAGSTALAVLCLEIYYRCERAKQND